MSSALIFHVDEARALEGASRFFPPAKTGNLKDPQKILQKQLEHQERLLADAAGSPLFGTVVRASFCLVTLPDPSQESLSLPTGRLSFGAVETFTVAEEVESLSRFLCGLTDVRQLVGFHPTTQARQLRTTLLRAGQPVPRCLGPAVQRLSVPMEIVGASDIEYPDFMPALGLQPTTPVEDLVRLTTAFNLF